MLEQSLDVLSHMGRDVGTSMAETLSEGAFFSFDRKPTSKPKHKADGGRKEQSYNDCSKQDELELQLATRML